MKMSDDVYRKLHASVSQLDTDDRRNRYRTGDFPFADKTKDLNQRYRWDLMWASLDGRWELLDGLNDSHIDTALRRMVPAL